MVGTFHAHRRNREEAWELANHVGGPFYLDHSSTQNAGYKVYRHERLYYQYVCDLGDRLELNMDSGLTFNIWYNL